MENCLCDECGSRIIIENGANVCQKCGLVHDPILESSSFQLGSVSNNENRKSQQYTSVNNNLAVVSSLGSSIGSVEEYMFRDANGSLLDESNQYKFRKFKTYYHIPGAIKGKETDFRTLKILNEVFSRLQIPNKIRERTLFLYQQYKTEHKEKITSGTSKYEFQTRSQF